jgi:hypothetical protein
VAKLLIAAAWELLIDPIWELLIAAAWELLIDPAWERTLVAEHAGHVVVAERHVGVVRPQRGQSEAQRPQVVLERILQLACTAANATPPPPPPLNHHHHRH